jgi:hypothetical protein
LRSAQAQLLCEMRGRALGLFLALEVQAQRAFLQGRQLGFGQLAVFDHLGQHGVAPLQGALGVEHGVVVARALEHAHQRGGLQRVELLGAFVEIGARRHLDAVGVVEEGYGVEVGLEDFVLGVERLDLQGRDGFLELAVERGCAADFFGIQVACELLREGGATLPIARGRAQHGAAQAPQINAKVVVEAVVFGGDQRFLDRRCNRIEPYPLAVRTLEKSQLLAIGREDLRGLLKFGLAKVADARRQRHKDQQVQQARSGYGRQSPEQRAPRERQAAHGGQQHRGTFAQ